MTDNRETKKNNNWQNNKIWIKDVLSKSGTDLMEIGKNITITTTTAVASSSMASSSQQQQSSTAQSSASNATPTLINVLKNGTAITKKYVRQKTANKECQQIKMVYNPSTQLIAKTEQASQQAQFCTPLRSTATATATAVAAATTPINYINQLQQHDTILLQQQPQSITTIPTATAVNSGNANSHYLLTNIKNEYSTTSPSLNIKQEYIPPPSITLYTRTATATATALHNNDTNYNNDAAPSVTILQTLQQQQQQQQQTKSIGGVRLGSATATATATATTLTPLTNVMIAKNDPIAKTTTVVSKTVATGRKAATGVNKPQFKCEQCGMTFGSKSAHTSHVKSHIKSGELPSTAADTSHVNAVELNDAGVPIGIPKTPPLKPNVNAHITGGDPYQCNVCLKTFAVPARLIRHYRTHTGERPFECEFCHKLFSVKENLQVHRRIHTKERPYKCDVCGRAFEHSGKLHRHMRIHTGERPHKCSVCEKTFIQSGQLVIHMRTHTGEKPYKCPVEGCGKGFTCSKQLKVHSRTHTGEKPYHCDICFRDFGYNHVLKLHRVQHYGSKCYKCTICDKTFKSKKEMEAHIKGHANEMPDDDDPEAGVSNGGNSVHTISSLSSSGGETTNSAPASPQSPASSMALAKASAANKTNNKKSRPGRGRPPNSSLTNMTNNTLPPSPSSPSSTFSPSSSMASTSRLSAGSPASPGNAGSGSVVNALSSSTLLLETDTQFNNSYDSGVASTSHQHRNQQTITSYHHTTEEMPTDLSMTPASRSNGQNYYQQHPTTYAYLRRSPIPDHTVRSNSPSAMTATEAIPREEHIINPALVEAIDIASRRDAGEEEVKQAALQMMQLHHSHRPETAAQPQAMQQSIPVAHHNVMLSSASLDHRSPEHSQTRHQDEDTLEADELIEHYKCGDLARHGLHKRFAPVPKFEASNESMALVRQIEAAIAPLRSSTESPERSSSPESDSLMLNDRDVMTLPLRKRKLYMSDSPGVTNGNNDDQETATMDHNLKAPLTSTTAANGKNQNGGGDNTVVLQKVLRMSSVIQFAKAS